MIHFSAYWRLMRFDKPIGILLLGYPTLWALWLATPTPKAQLVVYFILGTVIMRAAGCVMNDIADRNIDCHVERTRTRPLTSGEIGITSAIILLFILLGLAFLILMQLPRSCFFEALVAVGLVILYPFCKRLIQVPQLILGLAFSMGIPMAYTASGVPYDMTMGVIWLINFLFILCYDTMYAMADKADDLKIGVYSSAVFLGDNDLKVIGMMQVILHGLWLSLGLFLGLSWVFYGFYVLAGGVLVQQHRLIQGRDPKACFHAFLIAHWYGLFMLLAIIGSSNRQMSI
jgi:4-hydroxybenzoate polyprenyltransferase